MSSIKLMQLNIERDRHFARIFPFIHAQQPDVVCMQEIYERDVPLVAAQLGMHAHFAPMNRRIEDGSEHVQGTAVFSTAPIRKTWVECYAGNPARLPLYDGETADAKHATQNFGIAFIEIESDALYRIGTTHFPWTADASASDFQREDMRAMLETLKQVGEFVLTGDFNAPRGGEIFGILADAYTDHVPPRYTSSIDGSLHRAGALPYMVDGIFSSPGYIVTDVTMHTGVSDHCAILATVSAAR
jgi:endonuclease/exonuclease/phosphatase (EEP) superfamily protein YafD